MVARCASQLQMGNIGSILCVHPLGIWATRCGHVSKYSIFLPILHSVLHFHVLIICLLQCFLLIFSCRIRPIQYNVAWKNTFTTLGSWKWTIRWLAASDDLDHVSQRNCDGEMEQDLTDEEVQNEDLDSNEEESSKINKYVTNQEATNMSMYSWVTQQ